ncbi:peroxin 26 [Gaeumannomyces tritici R3-111a-1]|uniref:Peroxin 26 n=1 Tax=Gaeumannomyces tritici (strain R3-111a-1) TaxID=644352 RepID=J3P945_GAET3|nr:peroxin 26 [Gaeumannomyces tritici R3-111a-1]EJT73180.1 peroxin 26 [Gaeumannomyces tritici R3-111a-1]
MAFPGSPTATLSPTASEAFNFRSSISSFASSNSSRHSTSSVSKSYRQASTLFLTRRLPEALSTVLPLVTPTPVPGEDDAVEPAPVAKASRTTRVKVWSLYLTTLNAIVELHPEEGKASFGTQEWRAICTKVRDGAIWEEVVRNGYHGVEGDVDSDVVINLATLLLAHATNQSLNQKKLESYLASSNAPNLDLSSRFGGTPAAPSTPRRRHRSPIKNSSASGADTPRDLNARVKILELYTLHVLIRNNEWDYAREFISVSSVLDEERREAFLQALSSLQEEQQEQERQERAERERQEERLREDLHEARRLRAENEEHERRRRLEQQHDDRLRREGGSSEVDYGIESTPRAAVAKHRHTPSSGGGGGGAGGVRRKSSAHAHASKTHDKAKAKATAPLSVGARAAIIISNIRRLVVEGMTSSIQSNPTVVLRMLAFIVGLLAMLSNQRIRERVSRILRTSWDKVKTTARMGATATYL